MKSFAMQKLFSTFAHANQEWVAIHWYVSSVG